MTAIPTGFTLIRRRTITLLNGTFDEYQHVSGARVVHVNCADMNQTAAVSYRTPPVSDAGHAHVLEHMVLRGSARFPGERAFKELEATGLFDFFNACTAQDWTAYVACTNDPVSLQLGLRYFLDATLRPSLSAEVFAQEVLGETGEEGIVLIEMQGAQAQPAKRVQQAMFAALFPDTPYACHSGGDPSALRTLRLQEVRDYHRLHYVPANCTVMFYGAVALSDLLHELDAAWVGLPTGQTAPAPEVSCCWQDRVQYTAATEQVLLAWGLPPLCGADDLTQHLLNVLALTLLGHPNTPLMRVIHELGQVGDGTSYHANFIHPVFAVGVKSDGKQPLNAVQIQARVFEALREPFTEEAVAKALGLYALSVLDVQPGQLPYGMQLMTDILSAAQHSHDLYPRSLRGDLERLSSDTRTVQLLETLKEKYLLNNPHFSVIITEITEQQEQSLSHPTPRRLAKAKSLGLPTRPAPAAYAVPFKALPPMETLVSLDEQHRLFGMELRGAVTEVTFMLEAWLTAEECALLPTYAKMIARSPLGHELTERLAPLGANWEMSTEFHTANGSHEFGGAAVPSLLLTLRVLEKNLVVALDVLKQVIFNTPPGDTALARQALLRRAQALALHLTQQQEAQPHQSTMWRAVAHTRPELGWLDLLRGAQGLEHLQHWLQTPPLSLRLGEALEQLHHHLWQAAPRRVLVQGRSPDPLMLGPWKEWLDQSPSTPDHAAPCWENTDVSIRRQGHLDSVAYALPLPQLGQGGAAAAALLGPLLNEALYDQVRNGGGAYGLVCRTLPERGAMYMLSYRDPQAQRTARLFAAARLSTAEPLALDHARRRVYRQLFPLRSEGETHRRTLLRRLAGLSAEMEAAFLAELAAVTPVEVAHAHAYLEQAGHLISTHHSFWPQSPATALQESI